MGKFKMELIQMVVMEEQVIVTNKIFRIWQWLMDFKAQFKQEETWC